MILKMQSEQERDRANFLLQMVVAGALIALVFYCVWAVQNGSLKADSAVVGSTFTMFIVLVNFCFPNSIGSAKAQDTINKLAEKTPPVTGEAKESQDEQRAAQRGTGAAGPPDVGSGRGTIDIGKDVARQLPDLPPIIDPPSGPDAGGPANGVGQETQPGG